MSPKIPKVRYGTKRAFSRKFVLSATRVADIILCVALRPLAYGGSG